MSNEFTDLEPPRTFYIIERLELGLERMAARKMDIRSINLTEKDREHLNDALTKHWRKVTGKRGGRVCSASYKGHPVRHGNRSVIYSKHGVGITVPNPRQTRRTK